MRVIVVYADVLCPFTHAGLRRIVAERADRGADVVMDIRAWPLEWVNGEPLDPEFVGSEVAALRSSVAPDLFAGFEPGTFPSTAVPALGLAAAAYGRDLGTGEAVSLALRDAVFEHGLDVAADDVLDRIASAHGVKRPGDDAAVRAQYEAGHRDGVVGSPYFVVGDHRWFCPALDISHDDGGLHIEIDEEAGEEFDRQVFG